MAEKVLEEKREKNVAACFADSLSLWDRFARNLVGKFLRSFWKPIVGTSAACTVKIVKSSTT
jgi:hypothetical protein